MSKYRANPAQTPAIFLFRLSSIRSLPGAGVKTLPAAVRVPQPEQKRLSSGSSVPHFVQYMSLLHQKLRSPVPKCSPGFRLQPRRLARHNNPIPTAARIPPYTAQRSSPVMKLPGNTLIPCRNQIATHQDHQHAENGHSDPHSPPIPRQSKYIPGPPEM